MQEHDYFNSLRHRNMLEMHYNADTSGLDPNKYLTAPHASFRVPKSDIRASSSVIPKTQHA